MPKFAVQPKSARSFFKTRINRGGITRQKVLSLIMDPPDDSTDSDGDNSADDEVTVFLEGQNEDEQIEETDEALDDDGETVLTETEEEIIDDEDEEEEEEREKVKYGKRAVNQKGKKAECQKGKRAVNQKGKKVVNIYCRWRKKHPIKENIQFIGTGFEDTPDTVMTPYQYFTKLFDENLMHLVSEQTNL